MKPLRYPFYAVCISDAAGPMLVRPGVVYRVIKPLTNDPDHMVRLIDDEGEDYLYPAKWFIPVDLPPRAKRALSTVSRRELVRS
jgi:hypothetical protein